MPMRPYRRGLAMVFTGIVFLSFDGLLVRLAGTDGWTIVFWRGVFMFCALGLVSCLGNRLATLRSHPVASLASAVLLGLISGLFVLAIMHASVANVVVILSSAPLFAALFSRLFLHEQVPYRTVIAIAACMVGMLLVFMGSETGGMLSGNLYALAAAAAVGGNLTLLRRYPTIDRIPLIAGGGILAAVVALPMASPLALGGHSYGVLALMGLVQMPLATVLINNATRYLPSAEVALFYLVETVLGTLWVWWLLGEAPTTTSLLGGSVIIMALLVHAWLGLRREGSDPARLAQPVER
ncbi:EamA domain-containing membrane protein RarD [Modicisalibacter xianhensis]|uniref:EamA domain-containing membrane protein RarD n=1 Tax=Modicisalibacter xianhensis TaxID=442341 RepID=A0A4R8FTJ2_9GAMM|nr:DMT family transporter [Halomonas xianhensis]TDX29784.1 EamA domain-containing membrane protein RarD [Halomonas xianhensis]